MNHEDKEINTYICINAVFFKARFFDKYSTVFWSGLAVQRWHTWARAQGREHTCMYFYLIRPFLLCWTQTTESACGVGRDGWISESSADHSVLWCASVLLWQAGFGPEEVSVRCSAGDRNPPGPTRRHRHSPAGAHLIWAWWAELPGVQLQPARWQQGGILSWLLLSLLEVWIAKTSVSVSRSYCIELKSKQKTQACVFTCNLLV